MISGAVGITVPIYANHLGASPFLVGLIGSAGGLIYSFMPLVSGILSDRLNRKAFVSVSLFSYGFSCLLYNLIEEPLMLILAKVLEWLSIAGFWPAIESLIADSAEVGLEETLKRFNISWSSAMVFGPLLGGVLITEWSIKAPFLFSLFAAFSFGLLGLLIIVEPSKREKEAAQLTFESKDKRNRQGSILIALASTFLFSSMVGIILSLFPSYATDLGINPFEIGLITFVFAATRTVTFYQANRIEFRLGKLGMFLLGSLTLGLASFLTFHSTSTALFAVCFLIFGFGAGVSYAASISFILRRWESSRGYAAGVFESLIGVGYFVGSLIGGIISEYALNAPYLYGFVLSLAIFFIQLVLKGKGSTV